MLLALLALVAVNSAVADETANSWAMLVGGGSSKAGWASTYQQVRTLDVILRHQRPQAKTRGSGRWVNRKSVLIELPISWISSPDKAVVAGVTFNAAWYLTKNLKRQPYFLIGGGPVYTRVEIPGTSSNLRGIYQLGIGVEFRTDENNPSNKMFAELRYHHMSNGGLEKPNDSINSLKLLFGISFR